MTASEPAPPSARPARETSPPAPAGAVTVLVVDGDGVTRRYCELVLEREAGVHVETAATAAAALEVARMTPCDLVITEARLPDLDGLELVRRLRSGAPDGELPIVVLTTDERVERKVLAFAAGADDYVTKPCAADELRARVGRQVARRQAARAARRGPLLYARLTALPLPDLVGVLAMNRRTVTLEVRTPRGDGSLHFRAGRLVHAAYLSVAGPRAFYHLFAEDRGEVRLHDGCDVEDETVEESVNALILEAARRLDVARATGPAPGTVAVAAPARTLALPTRVHRLPPDRELALGFTRDLTDTYALAMLELRTADELTAWARRPTTGPRLQIVLVAPATVAATAIVSISTAPGERELAAAVDGQARCLTAALRGRDGREVDLIAIDPSVGLPMARALGQRPDLALVTVSERDVPADVGPHLRVLAVMAPAVLLSVGDPRLAEAVVAALGSASGSVTLGHHGGDLARPGELRRVAAEAVRLWLRGGR